MIDVGRRGSRFAVLVVVVVVVVVAAAVVVVGARGEGGGGGADACGMLPSKSICRLQGGGQIIEMGEGARGRAAASKPGLKLQRC